MVNQGGKSKMEGVKMEELIKTLRPVEVNEKLSDETETWITIQLNGEDHNLLTQHKPFSFEASGRKYLIVRVE